MAGAMRKMAVYLGLVEDDQYADDMYYDDQTREMPRAQTDDDAPRRSNRYSSDSVRVTEADAGSRSSRSSRDWRTQASSDDSHPAGTRTKPRLGSADPMKITTLQPRSYNDARRIGEEFRSGHPVIMNLTELSDGDAKRIVDFAAGLVFGLRGSIERVTNKVFMLTPANVDVSADVRAQLADGTFSPSR